MLVPSSTLAVRLTAAGDGQDLVDQGRFAGRTVPAKDDVSNLLDGILGHGKLPWVLLVCDRS